MRLALASAGMAGAGATSGFPRLLALCGKKRRKGAQGRKNLAICFHKLREASFSVWTGVLGDVLNREALRDDYYSVLKRSGGTFVRVPEGLRKRLKQH